MNRSIILFIASMFFVMTGINYAQSGWTFQTNPIPPSRTNDLGKIQFVSPTEGWISGPNGTLLHTTDSGTSWNIVTPFPEDTVSSAADPAQSMSWVDQLHGWKINWFGTSMSNPHGAVIHMTTDGGVSWIKKILTTADGDAGFQVQFTNQLNGRVLIYNFMTGAAQFLKTTDGGNTWNPFTGAGIFYFVDVNNGWAYSGSGPNGQSAPWKIYHTTDGGTSWSEQFSDDLPGAYHTMQFIDLNNGWIVGDSSKILKTTNGGADWQRITNTGINPESNSKCVFFLNANTGWIGTNDGIPNMNQDRVILYTTNGGVTWTKQYPGNDYAIFSIFFWDNNNGWFTADKCVQNCNEADSLKIWQGAIGHTVTGGTTGIEENKILAVQYSLSNNYPNPFNPNTVISWSIPSGSYVELIVYNTLGQVVKTLVSGFKSAGNYSSTFNASELPSGIYFYRLSAGQYSQVKKMTLLK